jgi:hypothetical protein
LLSGACGKAGATSKTNPKTTGTEAMLSILQRLAEFLLKHKLFIFIHFMGFFGISDGNAGFIFGSPLAYPSRSCYSEQVADLRVL